MKSSSLTGRSNVSHHRPSPTSRTGHRIAILVPTLKGGGAERKALTIASGLLDRGHEVDLVLGRLDCDYPDEVPGESRVFYIDHPNGDPESDKAPRAHARSSSAHFGQAVFHPQSAILAGRRHAFQFIPGICCRS